jgi:hypothetical protein
MLPGPHAQVRHDARDVRSVFDEALHATGNQFDFKETLPPRERVPIDVLDLAVVSGDAR